MKKALNFLFTWSLRAIWLCMVPVVVFLKLLVESDAIGSCGEYDKRSREELSKKLILNAVDKRNPLV